MKSINHLGKVLPIIIVVFLKKSFDKAKEKAENGLLAELIALKKSNKFVKNERRMLQNRVDPSGNIIRTRARGSLMGNRGVIHNEHQQIVRPFKLKAWIACKLEFKGRKRQVMTPDRWTELFFLDEATAFAAGHRPCFECRREDANAFKSFWLKGNPEYDLNKKTPVGKIDEILHKERVDGNRSKVTFEAPVEELPNGSFVLSGNEPYLVFDGAMFLWSPFGYEKKIALPDGEKLPVLTPRSIVNAFRAGYVPKTDSFMC